MNDLPLRIEPEWFGFRQSERTAIMWCFSHDSEAIHDISVPGDYSEASECELHASKRLTTSCDLAWGHVERGLLEVTDDE